MATTSPHLDTTSPHLDTTSPHLDTTSPHLDTTSPHIDITSPHLDTTSAHLDNTSAHLDTSSPHLDTTSPHLDITSLHFCHYSTTYLAWPQSSGARTTSCHCIVGLINRWTKNKNNISWEKEDDLCFYRQSWARDKFIILRKRQRDNIIKLKGQIGKMLWSRCLKGVSTPNIVKMQ